MNCKFIYLIVYQSFLKEKDKALQMKLQYMKERFYVPCEGWDGYREESE